MATMKWYSVAVRRLMAATEQRLAFFSLSSYTSPSALILYRRGDKKTRRGKIFKRSNGNAMPKKEKKIERIKDKIEVPKSIPWPLPFKFI